VSDDGWTLEQLGDRVRAALATGYTAPGSARVRAVPDGRTIRYYTTLGLVDRPTIQGRTALYGARHLLQLVAIKRLQASGLSLTQVQERLAGLPLARLRALAQVTPDEGGAAAAPADGPAGASPAAPAAAATPAVAAPPSSGPVTRREFWRAVPAAAVTGAAPPGSAREVTAGSLAPGGALDHDLPGVSRLVAVELAPGVTLTLGDARRLDLLDLLDSHDVEALRQAAGPLVQALTARGLLPGRPAGDREEGE
jgi:hypothetical protein